MLSITASERDKSTPVDTLRNSGEVPAVYYGRVESSTPITVEANEFERVFRQAGESSIVTLSMGDTQKQALIYDVQKHPVTGHPRHIDFYIVESDRTLDVSVPLEFTGTAPAVKELGGTLVKVLHEVQIEVLPGNLPSEIEVDISALKTFGDQIHVSDLKMPEGVTLQTDPEEVVALVSEAGEEEPEEEASEEPDLDSIEVEQRGKDEEESGEANSEEQ